jgi:hypothetical protein
VRRAYVVDAAGGAARLASDYLANFPSWSADDKWIYFGSDRSGRMEVAGPLQRRHPGAGDSRRRHRTTGFCERTHVVLPSGNHVVREAARRRTGSTHRRRCSRLCRRIPAVRQRTLLCRSARPVAWERVGTARDECDDAEGAREIFSVRQLRSLAVPSHVGPSRTVTEAVSLRHGCPMAAPFKRAGSDP